MNISFPAWVGTTVGFLLLYCKPAPGETLIVQPVADTTLIQTAPNNNLGGATFFNAGTTGTGFRNRGLLRFDVSEIPAGSTITEVTLSMEIVRQPAAGLQNSMFSLRRVFQPWGEGVQIPEESSPGLGSPAATGEATWNHRFAVASLWSEAGGQPGIDFSQTLSSTAASGGQGDSVNFESTAPLVDDVFAWINNPAGNFGWMLMTESEEVGRTARSFASRESGFGPTLTIIYTPVPEPGTIALLITALAFVLFRASRKFW